MKVDKQVATLKAVCKAISESDDATLENVAGDLLSVLMEAMDEQDGDDAYGTEGWRHHFGFE
jgi:hypothetical protein